MPEQSRNSDPVLDGIISGLQQAEKACLLTQAIVDNSRPIGQVASAMLAHMQDVLASDLPPELAPDDDMEYLERSVAIIAGLAAFVASDIAAKLAPDHGEEPLKRHDINKKMAQVSDEVRANRLNSPTLTTLLNTLAPAPQVEDSGDPFLYVVFQIQINEDVASEEGARNSTALNIGAMDFIGQQPHATFFIRHRVLSPWRTEWTDWELSGGGNLGIEHFNRPLKVEGVDQWIDFQGVNPTE